MPWHVKGGLCHVQLMWIGVRVQLEFGIGSGVEGMIRVRVSVTRT